MPPFSRPFSLMEGLEKGFPILYHVEICHNERTQSDPY